jgi:hypothetical protein
MTLVKVLSSPFIPSKVPGGNTQKVGASSKWNTLKRKVMSVVPWRKGSANLSISPNNKAIIKYAESKKNRENTTRANLKTNIGITVQGLIARTEEYKNKERELTELKQKLAQSSNLNPYDKAVLQFRINNATRYLDVHNKKNMINSGSSIRTVGRHSVSTTQSPNPNLPKNYTRKRSFINYTEKEGIDFNKLTPNAKLYVLGVLTTSGNDTDILSYMTSKLKANNPSMDSKNIHSIYEKAKREFEDRKEISDINNLLAELIKSPQPNVVSSNSNV